MSAQQSRSRSGLSLSEMRRVRPFRLLPLASYLSALRVAIFRALLCKRSVITLTSQTGHWTVDFGIWRKFRRYGCARKQRRGHRVVVVRFTPPKSSLSAQPKSNDASRSVPRIGQAVLPKRLAAARWPNLGPSNSATKKKEKENERQTDSDERENAERAEFGNSVFSVPLTLQLRYLLGSNSIRCLTIELVGVGHWTVDDGPQTTDHRPMSNVQCPSNNDQ